jgi:hypothetical protein
MSAQKNKKKASDETTEDLELEVNEDELKDVAGGLGLRLKDGRRSARVRKKLSKRLRRRDNPIGSLREIGGIGKKR